MRRRVDARDKIAAFRALLAGIRLELELRGIDRARQRDSGARIVDRKIPAVAGDVPVQLVEPVEKAELTHRAVVEYVFVVAGFKHRVRRSEVDAHAVDLILGVECLVAAVARDAGGREIDVHVVAEAVLVQRRKVAIDAVADLVAFGVDADRFVDLHAGVGVDGDVTVEREDAFVGERAACERDEREREQAHHAGASWSAPLRKNSAGLNANARARINAGNVSIFVLRSRTAPL